jgi:peptide deformylase
LRVYINPKIIHNSREVSEIYEGCGSVGADFFGPVIRPRTITIEAYDADLKKFRLTCDGLLARVIQHEYDHLSGVEFIEKISDYKRVMNAEHYQKLIRTSKKQVSAGVITKINCIELS